MNDLIETLKKNKLAWMFLNKEEQECLRQANKNAGVDNLKYDGRWENPGEPWADISGGENSIWRIKPDYQPEPEFVDLEIVIQIGHFNNLASTELLGCEVNVKSGKYFVKIGDLSSLPNFDDFWYQDSPGCKFFGIKETAIARCRFEGKKVFARFRKS